MPVSDHECAASATIDADPVSTPAAVLATANRPFAASATTTVSSDESWGWLVELSDTTSGNPKRAVSVGG